MTIKFTKTTMVNPTPKIRYSLFIDFINRKIENIIRDRIDNLYIISNDS